MYVLCLILYLCAVTLRDPLSGSTFRGFMLQGRQFVDDTTVAGTFAVVNNSISSLSSCSPPEVSANPLNYSYCGYIYYDNHAYVTSHLGWHLIQLDIGSICYLISDHEVFHLKLGASRCLMLSMLPLGPKFPQVLASYYTLDNVHTRMAKWESHLDYIIL